MLGKDYFTLFIKEQKPKGRKVIFPEEIQKKTIERFGKRYPTFLKILANSLAEIEVGIISFTDQKEEPASWFTPAKGQKLAKVVINIPKFPLLDTPEFSEEIKRLKKEAGSKIVLTVGEPKIIQKVPEEIGLLLVEPSLPEIVIEEITPQPLLLELGKDLKIYLPNIKGLGIEAESFKDKSSIGIELKRRDGKVLSIWQLVSWPSEICIGEKDYKIEKDSLTLFDEETEIRYPLKKGEKGEIIIDLSLIKSKEVEGFLRATS